MRNRIRLLASPLDRVVYALRSTVARWLAVVALVAVAGFGVYSVLPLVPVAVTWAQGYVSVAGDWVTEHTLTSELSVTPDPVETVTVRQELELYLAASKLRNVSGLRPDMIRAIHGAEVKAEAALGNPWITFNELRAARDALADVETMK